MNKNRYIPLPLSGISLLGRLLSSSLPVIGLVVAMLLLAGCQKKHTPIPSLGKKNRTVIEYMAADNNLYSNAIRDINEMESAWSAEYDGSLVVYLYPVASNASSGSTYDDRPRLLLIHHDDDPDKITSPVLKYYDRGNDPAQAEMVGQVIRDVRELAPANSYGLILWSHGSGWVPQAGPLKDVRPFPSPVTGRSFGEGGYTFRGTEMEISDLGRVLGGVDTRFDFIAFDACHMASIEVAYQLKDYADYFIASAAEIWSNGFPYLRMVHPMMKSPQADVAAMGREFFDYYNTLSGLNDATIVVLDNSKLGAVAGAVNTLTRSPFTGSFTATQQYGRGSTYSNTFYDLTDLIRTAWGDGTPSGGAALASYRAALAEATVYKATTSAFFGIRNSMGEYISGISCYIPSTRTPNSLQTYRSDYTWSTASGMGNLVR